MPPLPARIPALTGMRAVGAAMVYFHHFGVPFFDGPLRRWIWLFCREAHLGVQLFFVLSGFVITYRSFERASLGGGWFWGYLRNRVARIYPAYLVATFATYAVLRWQGAPWSGVELLTNVTLTKGFFDRLKFTGIAQGWSLTVEETFYFSAPLFFLAIRRGRGWLLPTLVPALGLLLVAFPWKPLGFFDNATFMLTVTFFGHCLEFFMGMALAVLCLRHRRAPGRLRLSSRPVYTAVGLLGAAGAMALLVWLEPTPPALDRYVVYVPVGWYDPAGIAIANVLFPAFIAVLFAGLVLEPTRLSELLSRPAALFAGESSYAFYLLHSGPLRIAALGLLGVGGWLGRLACVASASALLFLLVETPARRLLASPK